MQRFQPVEKLLQLLPVNMLSAYFSRAEDEEILSTNDVEFDINNIRDARLIGIYQSVHDYMQKSDTYFSSDYKLEDLASELNINKVAVSKALNQIGKITFNDLLNKYRIEAAKKMFREDTFRSKNIKQICLSVGFKYHTNFNLVFKKLEGITPSEFIVQCEKEKKE